MNKYKVGFFDSSGLCYYQKIAKHVDITTYCTLIDFSEDNKPNESAMFRTCDELELIQVVNNTFILTYISGQKITIQKC